MIRKLYLVRHGQTIYNTKKRVQGWSDSALTPLGKEQALAAGEFFHENAIHFDHAYASDSKRAVMTMQLIVQDQACPCRTLPGLREMSWGRYDGKPASTLPKMDLSDGMKAYGGESRQEAGMRVQKTLQNIMQRDSHHCVLVVSHSIVLGYLLQTLPRKPQILVPARIANGTILEYDVTAFSMICRNVWQMQ